MVISQIQLFLNKTFLLNLWRQKLYLFVFDGIINLNFILQCMVKLRFCLGIQLIYIFRSFCGPWLLLLLLFCLNISRDTKIPFISLALSFSLSSSLAKYLSQSLSLSLYVHMYILLYIYIFSPSPFSFFLSVSHSLILLTFIYCNNSQYLSISICSVWRVKYRNHRRNH